MAPNPHARGRAAPAVTPAPAATSRTRPPSRTRSAHGGGCRERGGMRWLVVCDGDPFDRYSQVAGRCGPVPAAGLERRRSRRHRKAPRAASRRQPRATGAPAPANCESGLCLPPGAAIRLAKFHTSCQFRHQFGICRQSLRRKARGHWSLSRRTTLIDDAVCRRPIRR